MSDRTVISQQDADAPQRLERGVLNVPNGIALAAAAMAPVLAVVLNAPAAGPVAGAALPLSFLLAFIACLFVGNTVVQFARRLPSAGSFYTFNTAGLGPGAGFFTGWLFWIGYAVLAPGLFGAFGAFVHDYFLATFDADVPVVDLQPRRDGDRLRPLRAQHQGVGQHRPHPARPRGRDLPRSWPSQRSSTRGRATTRRHYFTPSASPTGFSGVGLGVVFGILSFIGFDAAATLGEETRNPRRNVPLAVAGALGFVGIFYVIVMYALTAGYGLNEQRQRRAVPPGPQPLRHPRPAT